MAQMAQTKRFRVGVVPEHFSVPFQIGVDRGIFKKHNVELEVIEHPRGTGSMCKDLRENKLDVAVALTEGLIQDIARNGSNAFHIVASYTESPLDWGIAVAPDSDIKIEDDLEGKVFGVSRFGSGSHIMSFLLAERHGWKSRVSQPDSPVPAGLAPHQDRSGISFKVIGGFEDLRKAIKDHTIDCFMWERFMLKPYVDRGELKYAGSIMTPWPCFMIAVRNDILETAADRNEVNRLLLSIHECFDEFDRDKEDAIRRVSEVCHLQKDDAERWVSTVKFSKDGALDLNMLQNTMDVLVRCGVLSHGVPLNEIYNEQFTKSA